MNNLHREVFDLHAESDLEQVVNRVKENLKPGDILFLRGELGAGKTTFTRKLLNSLGFVDRVKSPTFTLLEPYDLRESQGFMLYHYDLYRLSSEKWEEIEQLGIRDQLAENAVLVIEWPDRLGNFLEPTMEISIDFREGDERKVTLCITKASAATPGSQRQSTQ